MTTQPYRTVALVVSAALRDDDTSVRLLLASCQPDQLRAICEASVLAMAEVVAQCVPADAIRTALEDAQNMARTEATQERTPR
ncbi:hypothetical protein [Streptomyces sp. NPDC094149]|uniref:hypothetical protein n=1 Tax=Streptomyces sp. NPDC094149 TaxID=3155079 RepID=UPI00331BFD2A